MKINTFIFITFGHLFFMASCQITRSLHRQEHADVIKSFTRPVRAWKNSLRGRMVSWFCY